MIDASTPASKPLQDPTPLEIKRKALEVVSDIPAEGIEAKDLVRFNKARAAILHMVLVRRHRYRRHEADPALSIRGAHDREMRQRKIIRRVLAGDIEAYKIALDSKWQREQYISNPYGFTQMTEKEIKDLMETPQDKLHRTELATRRGLEADKEIIKRAIDNLHTHGFISLAQFTGDCDITTTGIDSFPEIRDITIAHLGRARNKTVTQTSETYMAGSQGYPNASLRDLIDYLKTNQDPENNIDTFRKNLADQRRRPRTK